MKSLKFRLFHFLIILFIAFSCQSHKPSFVSSVTENNQKEIEQSTTNERVNQIGDTFHYPHLEIPFIKTGDELVYHTGYTLSYNEKHEQANWVAYELKDIQTTGLFKRSNRFLEDPQVSTGSATDDDYSHSGYDRGHLAPAADMSWSFATMTESFYYSNMSPQNPRFNRGIWKKLEEQVRNWANEFHDVFIVTGPILEENLSTIGPNKVSVPKFYFKVILDDYSSTPKGIGFIIPNEKSNYSLENYAVSIDEVEKVTGLDFFYKIPDEQENKIEGKVNLSEWEFKSGYYYNNSKKETQGDRIMENNIGQCKGVTKKGNRCLNKTKDPSGYCYLHKKQY